MSNLKGSRTEANLKAAFAGESQANRRYLYFAQKADVEGHNDVAAVFRSTAEGETGHAHGHLEYLEAVGDPATGLPFGDTANEPQDRDRRRDARIHRHVSGHGQDRARGRLRAKSPTGSRRWPRPSARTRTASPRRSAKSAAEPLLPPADDAPRRSARRRRSVAPKARSTPATAPAPQAMAQRRAMSRMANATTSAAKAVSTRRRAIALDWKNPEFYDQAAIDKELRARLRHLPRLPPLRQPVPRVSDAVRSRRRIVDDGSRRRREGRLREGRRPVLPVRPVLPDQVSVRAAASVERRFSAPDAAREGRCAPTRRDDARARRSFRARRRSASSRRFRSSSTRSTRSIARKPARKLLEKTLGVHPRCAPAGVRCAHRARAPEASRWRRAPAQAGRPHARQGRAVRHLLLQLLAAAIGRGSRRRAAPQRHRGEAGRARSLLRHAEARTRRSRQRREVQGDEYPGARRRGARRLGHHRGDSVVRADVQAGTAADVSGRRRRAARQAPHLRSVRIPVACAIRPAC